MLKGREKKAFGARKRGAFAVLVAEMVEQFQQVGQESNFLGVFRGVYQWVEEVGCLFPGCPCLFGIAELGFGIAEAHQAPGPFVGIQGVVVDDAPIGVRGHCVGGLGLPLLSERGLLIGDFEQQPGVRDAAGCPCLVQVRHD